MIKFKPEVRIKVWNSFLGELFQVASEWSLITGIDVEINSIDDSVHGKPTLHGTSLAVDFDTEGDKPEDLESLYQYMRVHTREGYDILHEKDHVHGERDVHRPESRIT